MSESRPIERWTTVEFVLEHFQGIRVIVPESPHKDHDTSAFAFWLSPGNAEKGMLCLREDYRDDDAAPFNYARASTYSVLQSLGYFSRQRLRASVLATHIPDSANPYPHVKVDETHPPSLVEEFH